MEDAKRKELERWAAGLTRSEVAELRAAGRAIKALSSENVVLERRIAWLERRLPVDGGEAAAPARFARTDSDHYQSEQAQGVERTTRDPRRVASLRSGVVLVGAAVVVLGLVAVIGARAAGPELAVSGPAQGAVIGRAGLSTLEISAAVSNAEWLIDGKRIQPQLDAGRAVWRPERLPEGEHQLVVRRKGSLFTSVTRTIRFTVDLTPPALKLAAPAAALPRRPLELVGALEPGSVLRHAEKTVRVDATGRFRLVVPNPPRRLVLTATDAAANSSRWRVPVSVVAVRPSEPIRAVHVTAYAWADRDLRNGVLELIRARKINAVELDLKDESGEVGWASGVPLAKRIGAQRDIYDLGAAVKQLHRLGVRVIGRLVCFRDPIHAEAAWRAGRTAEVVQAPAGGRYAGYGGFTNFANPAVRKYNIELAVAAARLGVDEVLYDYVRRPDGPLASMVFAGIKGTPEQAIAEFLAQSRSALADTDALIGASVFGVAATRPKEVAQDIRAMARHVDYIAPMLYPSHWAAGEYNVPDPNGQPYEIVRRSTRDFIEQVRGTGARVVNWLQDFSYGRAYGPAEVRAQIDASRDAGVDEFVLWDAAVTYTAAALEPTARFPAHHNTSKPPDDAPLPVRLPDPVLAGKSGAKAPAEAQQVQARRTEVVRPLSGLSPNELGQVPVVMHHMIRPDRVGAYDQTPAEFRAELDYLWKHGYTAVNVGELLSGTLDVPKGTTPVAFTFDDATTYQLDFTANGRVKPDTAVGIMLEFARKHPGFVPKGTFYVNRTPFGSEAQAKRALRWLVENGFEIGNHTHDHVPLRALDDEEIQRQLATGASSIRSYVPGYRITSMALPLGSLPHSAQLTVQGRWRGTSYGPYGVMLVGANPAPSPFSTAFNPAAVPRIRTSHGGWNGEADYTFSYWMNQLEQAPHNRYVSDGDPATITIPKGRQAELKQRFRSQFRTAK